MPLFGDTNLALINVYECYGGLSISYAFRLKDFVHLMDGLAGRLLRPLPKDFEFHTVPLDNRAVEARNFT